MIRDITIGQYYPVKSYIHALDARTKIIATFVYLFTIFLVDKYLAFVLVAVFLGGVIYSSKVPLKFILKR